MAASPFNDVKLDLGIIIVLSVIVLVLVTSLVDSEVTQVLGLLAYGILATGWIIFRTRNIMRRHQQDNGKT